MRLEASMFGRPFAPLFILFALILSAAFATPAWATPPDPRIAAHPPQPPAEALPQNRPPASPETPAAPLALPPLKAVLIVGPIDGDAGAWTTAEKKNMDLTAAELTAHGVTVHKFYAPNNDWNAIKAAAAGAQFIFYRGHGVYWSDMPAPVVGGFALKDRFVSSDDIRRDLHPAPNAIVMLYGCFTAGTSSNDEGSIGSAEAQRRVAMYSDPFLDIGAAGYYADWFGDAFQMYVRYLFQGQTLGQAYESFYDFHASSVERYMHPNHPGKVMWLDKDYWDGKMQYNDAFAGLPNARLTDLFQDIQMQIRPNGATYVARPNAAARTFKIVVNGSQGAPLRWQAEFIPQAQAWATLATATGDSSRPILVTLAPGGRSVGRYTTTLRITTDTPGVSNAQQIVPIVLNLTTTVRTVRLPVIMQ